jgi:predicted DNA-binding mobile mystery protein A
MVTKMKATYRKTRVHQMVRSLAPLQKIPRARPARGWLRAIREALGLSLEEVGRASNATKQRILSFEKAEANDRITLRSLRRVAEAMECELVYAIVPRSGDIRALADRAIRNKIAKRVRAVEHTMALEDQAPGGVEELIDEETERRTRKP